MPYVCHVHCCNNHKQNTPEGQLAKHTWRSAEAFFQEAVPLKASRMAPGPKAIRHLVSCFFSHSSS